MGIFHKWHFNIRKAILMFFDVFCICVFSAVFYFLMRFTNAYSIETPVNNFILCSAILVICISISRVLFGVYRTIWRYTSTISNFFLGISDVLGAVLAIVFSLLIKCYDGIGVWLFITVPAVSSFVAFMSRFTYRLIYKNLNTEEEPKDVIRVGIVGAGQIGVDLLSDLQTQNSNYKPVCFFDTDKNKIGSVVAGLSVFAQSESAKIIDSKDIKLIIIAIKNLDNNNTQEIFNYYKNYPVEIKIYEHPLLSEVGQTNKPLESKGAIRNIHIEDLLFRKQINITTTQAASFYKDKTILVTGGGGSIGSELCRQIAQCQPKQLIIFDIYENNAYDIQQELILEYGNKLNLSVEIGSVRDVARLDMVFRDYRPDIVFHAAAHKHVPLMEHSGCEAIKNNVFGTYNTANMAEKYHVQKFILVSTDKAVNPTNIMGATKRLCEMILQSKRNSETKFSAVRFGNVLGSNGSVIPLFKRQIEAGGPLTITDKRIIRYFMTIKEASQLVMQAGAMAKEGELFVLDMGQPVRIYDLALNMIKLSGLVPNEDIEIKEVGLRPGEKLYEELLMKTDELTKTDNNKIFIEKETQISREEMEEKLSILCKSVEDFSESINSLAVKNAIKICVPTYKEPEEVNKYAEQSKEMNNVK